MFPNRADGYNRVLGERILVAVGGALLTIAPYLTWISVVILGSFNLTGLLGAGHAYQWISYLVSAVGLGVVLVAVLVPSMFAVRVTALSIGSVLLLGGGLFIYGLVRAVSDSAGLGQMGVGPVTALAGSLLLVIPPIVGLSQRPTQPWYPGAPRRVLPVWVPAAAGLLIALLVTWTPGHAGAGNYCGTPIGAAFKSDQKLPSDTPPPATQAQLSQDAAAVSSAQQALDQQQQGGSQAQHEQNAADAASAQAQQADQAATAASSQVDQDQLTVSEDQSKVAEDQATVDGDQSTVASDQSMVQLDQQTLNSDQAAGYPTSFDQTELNQAQQTESADQATEARDQQTLNSDQAALSKAQAKQQSDQNAASAAQQNANQLDQQSQTAQNAAANASANAEASQLSAQQQLDQATQQQDEDNQTWQDAYQTELTAARAYNADLGACQHQANVHFIAAGLIGGIGGAMSVLILLRRRRQSPPSWPSPAVSL